VPAYQYLFIAIIVFSQGISAVRPGLVVVCATMPLLPPL
jgi:hypothetical protein